MISQLDTKLKYQLDNFSKMEQTLKSKTHALDLLTKDKSSKALSFSNETLKLENEEMKSELAKSLKKIEMEKL